MSKQVNKGGASVDPLLTRPEKVAIVALGPSKEAFLREQMSTRGMKSPFDEVWTVNRGFRGFHHDKLFVMDDLKWLEEKDETYAGFLRKHDCPIITSTVYPEYPEAIAYPLQEVLETIEDDIFCQNTVSYMLAYAMHIRVQEVSIYGADFVYPNGITAESGGQAMAFLLGLCRHFGIYHRIPGESTLLYANQVKPVGAGTQRTIYGYHRIEQMQKKKDADKALKAERKKSLKGDK